MQPLLSQTEPVDQKTQLLTQNSATPTRRGEMLYRNLGRTGEQVSVIGLGGYHIGSIKEKQENIKLIRSAYANSINVQLQLVAQLQLALRKFQISSLRNQNV
ncbi:MAG: hypothetical protein V7K55_17585 [Nostoc sp.]|uniref:hypothetical protein n=1 Tax=Nostoc sp. TaxID=1180 RepID=UPI002FFA9EE1